MFSVLSLNFGFCLVLFKRLTIEGMNVVKFRRLTFPEFMTLFARLFMF